MKILRRHHHYHHHVVFSYQSPLFYPAFSLSLSLTLTKIARASCNARVKQKSIPLVSFIFPHLVFNVSRDQRNSQVPRRWPVAGVYPIFGCWKWCILPVHRQGGSSIVECRRRPTRREAWTRLQKANERNACSLFFSPVSDSLLFLYSLLRFASNFTLNFPWITFFSVFSYNSFLFLLLVYFLLFLSFLFFSFLIFLIAFLNSSSASSSSSTSSCIPYIDIAFASPFYAYSPSLTSSCSSSDPHPCTRPRSVLQGIARRGTKRTSESRHTHAFSCPAMALAEDSIWDSLETHRGRPFFHTYSRLSSQIPTYTCVYTPLIYLFECVHIPPHSLPKLLLYIWVHASLLWCQRHSNVHAALRNSELYYIGMCITCVAQGTYCE